MPKANLERLWEEWEGRLLLINLASQLHGGMIKPEVIAPFLRKATNSAADFTSRHNALADESESANGFRAERLYFCSSRGADAGNDLLLLRIAPMDLILGKVDFGGPDAAARRARATSLLDTIRDTSEQDERKIERATKLLLGCLSPDGRFSPDSEWKLPEWLSGFKLAPGKIMSSGVALKPPNGEPTFFAPLTGSRRGADLFGKLHRAESQADYARDVLGLDHYGPEYKGLRTILGFYLVRSQQIVDIRASRPSPFDRTSPGRFRGSYGTPGGTVGEMGRTANLANLNSGDDVEGVNEVVCPNNPLHVDRNDVLVGYLGAVTASRKDTYREGQPPSPWDEKFLEICAGGCSKSHVIDMVVQGGRA